MQQLHIYELHEICFTAIWCITYALFEIVVIIWRRRLYHVIAAAVFPERQRLRARWLVLHILAERKLMHHTDRLARIYQPLLFGDLTTNFFFLDIFYLRYQLCHSSVKLILNLFVNILEVYTSLL